VRGEAGPPSFLEGKAEALLLGYGVKLRQKISNID
jgi:hypothetical protein